MGDSPPKRHFRFGLSTLFMLVTCCAMVLVAARQFLLAAMSIDGMTSGVLLGTIACVCGSIFAINSATRWIVAVVSIAFFYVIVTGLVRELGDSTVLWSFACLSIGLFVGSVFRPVRTETATE